MDRFRLPLLRVALLLASLSALLPGASAQTAMPVSGQPVPSLAQLDTIMQQNMAKYNAPGANLSVSVDGRLVFARGYGYANTTTGEFVQPDSRMRLASNSKPFTAAAIYKLIEQGKLTLATKPFASILNDLQPPSGSTEDPRILNITIQNLLEHKAGYDDGAGYPFDPVNSYTTNRAAANAYGLSGQACTPKALISYELGTALQHDPGTTYAYSNLGYLTLGYIIERVTGTPYATWLEQNIFPLANMQQTLPAGNLAADKLPYEVAYYGQEGSGPSMVPPVGTTVPYEYGALDLQLELANGGWTSTPMDLLRFNDSLNGQFSTNILANPPSGFTGEIPPLGQGWEYVFYGSLPGTNSLVHLNTSSAVVGRVVYSAIFNSRSGSNLEEPESDADNAISTFVKTVKSWPAGDLFPNYATSGTACAFTLASTTASAPMAGTTSTLAVTDANYCAYSAVANSTWLHVTSGAFLNDNGTVGYTVDANSGAPRTGTITIAGQTLTVSQVGVTTATTLMLAGNGVVNGSNQTVSLTATLSPYSSAGNSTDGEIVTIQFGGNNPYLCKAALASGKAACSITLPAADTSGYNASYAGDTYFSASSVNNVTISQTGTPVVTLNPSSLTFPSTQSGQSAPVQTVTVTNTGTAALIVSNVAALSGNNQFTQTNTCTAAPIQANSTCTVSVTFSPSAAGSYTGTVLLTDNGNPTTQSVSLSGTATTGPAPAVTFAPASLAFPATQVGSTSASQSINLTNTGTATLNISAITASAGFNVLPSSTCGSTLTQNSFCVLYLTSTPSSIGPYNGSLTVTSNAAAAMAALSGTGAAYNAPTVTLTGSPGSLTYGSPVMLSASSSGVQSGATYTWSVLDGSSTVTSGVAYSATFNYTIANPTAGPHSYTAVLSSNNGSVYPPGTSNAFAVTVAKASTTSSFAMPAPISYGTPLGSAQLAATSSTPGTFSYTPPAGAILNAGTQTLSATLNPTDSTDYSPSTANTTLLVNKGTLTATANNATRAYGATNPAFTGTVTGVVNADPITATYLSTLSTTAAPGTAAAITPSLNDPSMRLGNYNVTLNPGTVTVVKAGTSVTLTAPGNVAAGVSVTFTATASSATTGTPTGSVTFSSATGTLGTANLLNGVATLSVALPMGSSSVTATYAGDTNFNGSASPAITVVSGLPDFSVSATPSTSSVTAGKTVLFTLTATPVSGFNAPITYSCSGLPAHAQCFFAPATVTPSGAPVSSVLTLGTSVPAAAQLRRIDLFRTGLEGSALAALLFVPVLRRRSVVRLGRLSLVVLLALLGITAAGLTGCGYRSSDVTPTGSYTVTVNAASGSATHNAVLTVTVQ